MAPALSPHSTSTVSSTSIANATSVSARPGPRAWEALPAIAYGFVTYPLTPTKTVRRQSRQTPLGNGGVGHFGPNSLSTLREEPETELMLDDIEYSEQATLEIGDEVYAFEKLVPETRNGAVWYRG